MTSQKTQDPYSEEEAPPIDDASRCWWRLDPEETFSDWKIEITTTSTSGDEEDETIVETYFVHKCILVSGNRRSGYFAHLFRNSDRFEESKDSTSRITLDPMAAKAFPILLDYLYAPEQSLEITTENATALHYLGEYFEIRQLRWDARQFCQKDISLMNAETYYQHATQFQNETILGLVGECLGKDIHHVGSSSALIQKIDSSVWVKAARVVDPKHTKHWSRLVCEVGKAQSEQMDMATLECLTDPSVMPQIHPKVALKLCELEDKLVAMQGDESSSTTSSQQGLSSLQERCATALSLTWKSLPNASKDNRNALKQRKPTFLVDLLVKVIQESQAELQASQHEVQQAKTVIGRFRPLSSRSIAYGETLTPKEVVLYNPTLAGVCCGAYEETYFRNGRLEYQACPIFYFDSPPDG